MELDGMRVVGEDKGRFADLLIFTAATLASAERIAEMT
jgi:hypothetical protein